MILMEIRVTPTMAACECGWYVNTLDGSAARKAADSHSYRKHNGDAEVHDTRRRYFK